MAAKFGTSGLRGLATELVGEPAVAHTRAFIQHLQKQRLVKPGDYVCVAADFRTSSPALRANIQQALAAEGMKELYFGATPTPALAFEAQRAGRAAIMITGSHIPADRNGLKFYRPDGEITKADEKAIVKAASKLRSSKLELLHTRATSAKGFEQRLKVLASGKPLSGMRIGVYQHSTVARDLLVETLERAGAQVTALGRSTTFIPVDTEAISEETQHLLRKWCASRKFDAIVSADGDGDRPLVSDEAGTPLRGDLIGLATARYLGAQTVVTPITSNSGLGRHLPLGTISCKVGSPYVIAAMNKARKKRARAIVGFEANGGFFTLSPFKRGRNVLAPLPTRDCFLPIIAVLTEARKSKQPLSRFVAGFALPVALSGRLENFATPRASNLMARLQAKDDVAAFLASIGLVRKVNRLDGLRATLADGSIIHLRPSGNAPEFRVYVEAQTKEKAEALLSQVLSLVSTS